MAVVVKEESEDQLAGLVICTVWVIYIVCALCKLSCWHRRHVRCTAQAKCHDVIAFTQQWNFGPAALLCSQKHVSCLTLRLWPLQYSHSHAVRVPHLQQRSAVVYL